jgi:hypothetical protein
MTSTHQIAVPSQDRVRTDDQMQPTERITGQRLEQCCEESPVLGGEPGPVRTQLPLQDRELMAQSQDLRILVPVAHRKQTQRREGVGHGEIGQTQQHNRPSCPSLHREHSTRFDAASTASTPSPPVLLTCTDEVFGRRKCLDAHDAPRPTLVAPRKTQRPDSPGFRGGAPPIGYGY